MKKTMCLMLLFVLFTLVLLYSFAIGEINPSFPESAAKLFQSARWEGYQPVVVSGHGDENSLTGQYAVLMKKGDHNVLCMVEKEQGQDEFFITVENDKAVYQGDLLPSLFIDSAGDALFYTYQRDAGDIRSERYHSSKVDGQWLPVDVILFHKPQKGLFLETLILFYDNRLQYEVLWTDENDNVIEQSGKIGRGLVDTSLYELSRFDVNQFLTDFHQWKLGARYWPIDYG